MPFCELANIFPPNWQQEGLIINREPGKYFGELGAVKHARLVPGPPRCAVPLYCLAGWRNPDANGDLRVTCIIISTYSNGVFQKSKDVRYVGRYPGPLVITSVSNRKDSESCPNITPIAPIQPCCMHFDVIPAVQCDAECSPTKGSKLPRFPPFLSASR